MKPLDPIFRMTNTEMRIWRNRHRWSQEQAAFALEISVERYMEIERDWNDVRPKMYEPDTYVGTCAMIDIARFGWSPLSILALAIVKVVNAMPGPGRPRKMKRESDREAA